MCGHRGIQIVHTWTRHRYLVFLGRWSHSWLFVSRMYARKYMFLDILVETQMTKMGYRCMDEQIHDIGIPSILPFLIIERYMHFQTYVWIRIHTHTLIYSTYRHPHRDIDLFICIQMFDVYMYIHRYVSASIFYSDICMDTASILAYAWTQRYAHIQNLDLISIR